MTPSSPTQGRRRKCSQFQYALLGALAHLAIWQAASIAVGGDPQPLEASPAKAAVNRTINYLNNEITSWNKDHTCYSCHNSGDAIRALLIAKDRGYPVDSAGFRQTTAWLRQPEQWSRNGPDGEFNDRRLAQLQFSAALSAAEAASPSAHRPLEVAAGLLSRELQADGRWPSEQLGTIGSPITYGPFLALVQARNVLRVAGRERFSGPIDRANRWLRDARPKSVLNAAAVLWAMAGDTHPDAAATRAHCLDLIRRGQSRDGGWGPYVTSATEPFDTAIVILALQSGGGEDVARMLEPAREFLLATQLPDGSWPETTRPADRESYAHRVSTTAWCLHALVMAEID